MFRQSQGSRLHLAILAIPHHQGHQERDEANGHYDEGEQNVFRWVDKWWMLQGTVDEVHAMGEGSIVIGQGIGVTVVQGVGN